MASQHSASETSFPTTSEDVSSTMTALADAVLALYSPRRPGWHRQSPASTPSQTPRADQPHFKPQGAGSQHTTEAQPSNGLICHTCYARGHISRQCILTLTQLSTVLSNYESLTDTEKSRVPDTSYKRVKYSLIGDPTLVTETPVGDTKTAEADAESTKKV